MCQHLCWWGIEGSLITAGLEITCLSVRVMVIRGQLRMHGWSRVITKAEEKSKSRIKKHQRDACLHLQRSSVLSPWLKILLSVIWDGTVSWENFCKLTARGSERLHAGPSQLLPKSVSSSLTVKIQYHSKTLGLVCEVLVNDLSAILGSAYIFLILCTYSTVLTEHGQRPSV